MFTCNLNKLDIFTALQELNLLVSYCQINSTLHAQMFHIKSLLAAHKA